MSQTCWLQNQSFQEYVPAKLRQILREEESLKAKAQALVSREGELQDHVGAEIDINSIGAWMFLILPFTPWKFNIAP